MYLSKIRQSLAISLLFSTLFVSCKKDTVSPPAASSGKLFGTVQTWDDKLNSTSDLANITVSITNTTGGVYASGTDAGGIYSFASLPYDIYDITLSKPGYGTTKVFGITHSNTGTQTQVPSISFGKLSTTTVTAFSVASNTFNGQPGVSFNYTLSPVPTVASRGFVRYFLSATNDVSSSSYTAFSPLYNFSNLSNVTGFTVNDLIGMGFTSGQTVYVRMYGDSFRSNEYQDPNTRKWVFPNVNATTTAAVSFIVP